MDTSAFMADVGHQDFDTLVLGGSREVPVLVDFWAAWCAPCKALMPVLAKLADEYAGQFFLAKVNTDVERELATKYGVRSLPTVTLFKNGEAVDGFMGVQSESFIRQLLDRYVARASDDAIDTALAALKDGQHGEAEGLLRQAIENDPTNDRIKIELAKLLFERSRYDEARETLDSMSVEQLTNPEVVRLQARLAFTDILRQAPPADELAKIVAAKPADCMVRYQLSAYQVLAGDYETAMQNFLEIVKRDRKFNDDAGRKALLNVFQLLGNKNNLVRKYRTLLSSVLL
jgi:putative thioredoxin